MNLSLVNLKGYEILGDVAAALEAAELAPGELVLEITESTVMREHDMGRDMLRKLKKLGLGLALDDFGSHLDLKIVAAGVETAAQHASLRAIGCELGQGFLLAKPAPASTIDPERDRATGIALASEAASSLPEPARLTLVRRAGHGG